MSVRPVPTGEPFELESWEGLLVVHVSTDTRIDRLDLGGTQVASGLSKGEHLLLLAVGAGDYAWSSADRGDVRYYLSSLPKNYFQIEAGRINFIGLLELESAGAWGLRARIIDRTARAYELVAERYPALLASHPPVYVGVARHVFLDYYLEALAARPADRAADEVQP